MSGEISYPRNPAERGPIKAPTYGLKPPLPAEMKRLALGCMVTAVNRHFGLGSAVRLGDGVVVMAVDVIPTGSLAIDRALGAGGFPRGRISEIYGTDSCGKTTLALHVIAEAQRQGGHAVFVDAEHALDLNYARRIGVNIDNLVLSKPRSAEQTIDVIIALINSHAVDVVVVDSVAALVPQAELQASVIENTGGELARVMSNGLRKLAGIVARTNTCLLFLNQLRDKYFPTAGNSELTAGGRSLRFYASVRMELSPGAAIPHGNQTIGRRARAYVLKNRCAPPHRAAEFEILHGQGISFEGELLDLGIEAGLVRHSGAGFVCGAHLLGSGREEARGWLRHHPETARRLTEELRERLGFDTLDEAMRTRGEECKAVCGF